jgi:hypothetical protein
VRAGQGVRRARRAIITIGSVRPNDALSEAISNEREQHQIEVGENDELTANRWSVSGYHSWNNPSSVWGRQSRLRAGPPAVDAQCIMIPGCAEGVKASAGGVKTM